MCFSSLKPLNETAIMPPKKASAKSASRRTRIPPIMQVPKNIRASQSSGLYFLTVRRCWRRSNSARIIRKTAGFLPCPVEITIYIIKSSGLDAFDTACLMLTCKEFATLITNFNFGPVLKTQLQSTKENDILDRYEFESEPNFSDESDAEGYRAYRHDEQKEFKARTLY